jgi:hypothetical protein
MAETVAFNVRNVRCPARCEGYRVYVADDRLYFIAVDNLEALRDFGRDTGRGQMADTGDYLRNYLMFGWLGLLFAYRRGGSAVGGRDAWRIAEQTPLDQRLPLHPDNFVMLFDEFQGATIAPVWSLFFQTYGRWTFTHPNVGQVAMDFHTDHDLAVAMLNLPALLPGLHVQGRYNPRTRQLEG